MARQKKPVHRVQMTEGKRNIIHQLLEEYDIQSAEDIQDALKDLLGGTIKEMMEAEMDDHLGYEKSERSDNDDYRNGYKRKQVNSRYGSMEIEVPQDRKSTFEPQVVKKRQKDISDIDQKIISMYAKGMTTRQISETIEDIYGFETSESFISDVTDKILPQIEDWQNRPLDEVYPILYIDAIHYSVRDNGVIRKLAAYVILGINTEGKKEVLTISVGDNESAKYWLSVMNELKNRGVKDVLIICAALQRSDCRDSSIRPSAAKHKQKGCRHRTAACGSGFLGRAFCAVDGTIRQPSGFAGIDRDGGTVRRYDARGHDRLRPFCL